MGSAYNTKGSRRTGHGNMHVGDPETVRKIGPQTVEFSFEEQEEDGYSMQLGQP